MQEKMKRVRHKSPRHHARSLSAIRFVHEGNLACNCGPFELSFYWKSTFQLLGFFPFEKFIAAAKPSVSLSILERKEQYERESKVGLNNDVQATCSHEAAVRKICQWTLLIAPESQAWILGELTMREETRDQARS